MPEPLLTVRGLTKRYAVTVLDQASLEVRAGEIHGLLGANGAGKSTLCRIIAGLLTPTAGQMTFNRRAYEPANKQDAESLGIQMVQQELNLIPSLSVAENIMLGRTPHRFGVIRQRDLHRQARRALDRFALRAVATDTIASTLGVGHQQMVEIASALDRDCSLLILDEPTAALSAGESEILFQKLDDLRKQGVGIIYVSHRLDEVSRLTDRITILRDGKHVCTRETSEVTTDDMINTMAGETRPSTSSAPRAFLSHANDRLALRVSDFSRGHAVRSVSFEVRQGERFGIAGLVGSGRTELLRLMFGADPADSGSLTVGSAAPQRFTHPSQAVAAGLAMVTEDRKQDGLLLPHSIRVNASLAALGTRFSTTGRIDFKAEAAAVKSVSDQLEIRSTGIEQSVQTLSGGNQQKAVVGKWLLQDASVFLFDEPTRGIDVAARRRIYQLFESLAANGKAVLIVSSDLEELMETCDRIAVMSAGKMVQCFSRDDWSEDAIMQAAFSEQVGV